MSADNGIYTLITAAPDGSKEYRVAYGSAIGNIYANQRFCMSGTWGPKWHPGLILDLDYAYKYFGQAPVFTNQQDAARYAQGFEDEYAKYGGTEYGTVTFDHSGVPFPEQSMVSPVGYP